MEKYSRGAAQNCHWLSCSRLIHGIGERANSGIKLASWKRILGGKMKALLLVMSLSIGTLAYGTPCEELGNRFSRLYPDAKMNPTSQRLMELYKKSEVWIARIPRLYFEQHPDHKVISSLVQANFPQGLPILREVSDSPLTDEELSFVEAYGGAEFRPILNGLWRSAFGNPQLEQKIVNAIRTIQQRVYPVGVGSWLMTD